VPCTPAGCLYVGGVGVAEAKIKTGGDCYVKEANVERLHTVGFQLYDILEKTKLQKP